MENLFLFTPRCPSGSKINSNCNRALQQLFLAEKAQGLATEFMYCIQEQVNLN